MIPWKKHNNLVCLIVQEMKNNSNRKIHKTVRSIVKNELGVNPSSCAIRSALVRFRKSIDNLRKDDPEWESRPIEEQVEKIINDSPYKKDEEAQMPTDIDVINDFIKSGGIFRTKDNLIIAEKNGARSNPLKGCIEAINSIKLIPVGKLVVFNGLWHTVAGYDSSGCYYLSRGDIIDPTPRKITEISVKG